MRRGLIGPAIAAALVVAIVGGLAATTGIGDLEIFTPGRGTDSERLSTVEDFLAENSEAVKTELSRMQQEIDALAEAAVTASPTPAPEPAAPGELSLPITVSGTGSDAQFVTLTDGLWALDVLLENNSECSSSNRCVPGRFSVEVETVDGLGRVDVDSVDGTRYDSFRWGSTEIVDADWRDRTFLRVGVLWNPDLDAGKQVVSVTAASTGEWTLTFRLLVATQTVTPAGATSTTTP
ncbi:MAG: hypothetical protein OXG33_06925 [Chloroflexi bacterium]|nr:hypothetical protein [Chloroflexota bacterium]